MDDCHLSYLTKKTQAPKKKKLKTKNNKKHGVFTKMQKKFKK